MTSHHRNLTKMASNVSCVPTFDTAGDPSALAVKWGRWKRAFELFLVARGETPEARERSLLLHCAGMSVEDIVETLPNKGVNYDDAVSCPGWLLQTEVEPHVRETFVSPASAEGR